MNIAARLTSAVLIATLIVGLSLTACQTKNDWVSAKDDTILDVADALEGVIAIGAKRIYVVAGVQRVYSVGKFRTISAGQCADTTGGVIHNYRIKELVDLHGKDYPMLHTFRCQQALADQVIFMRKNHVPSE